MIRKPPAELTMEQEIKDSFSIIYLDGKNFPAHSAVRLYYHRIYLINEGMGALCIDDRHCPITGKELFLMAKGQTFSFQPHSNISGYELSFGDYFWEKAPASASNCKAVLFNDVTTHQRLPVGAPAYHELDSLFRALYEEFVKVDYINKPDAMAAYLKIIMIKIANINASLVDGYEGPASQLYRQFLELLHHQYRTNRDVAEYAGQLNISARKLSDLCREQGGKGAKEIINSHLIAEAKRFLQFSSKPIKEIAFDLNFHTPEQFSHFFKAHAWVSPLVYRNAFVNIGR
ncbi:MAG TPA: AraC family transcriptional regulator [Puia sp.]